jgi:DNA-binding transcriptional LysR family regulator
MSTLLELRLADLVTLLAVERTGTISGAARELRVSPSQVSKAVSRLERLYQVRLLTRGARGVAATPAARRMLPHIASAVEALRATNGARDDEQPDLELAIAGPAYLIRELLPTLVLAMPGVRMRTFEMPAGALRASVAENIFDMALVPGGLQKPLAGWTSEAVGELRSGLLARPEFAEDLRPLPLTPARVRSLHFVVPMQGGREQLLGPTDDCPLRPDERVIAHEVQTIACALEFVAKTDHVVFGPLVAARTYVASGALREIPVARWNVVETVHLVCSADRVLERVRATTAQAARDLLEH